MRYFSYDEHDPNNLFADDQGNVVVTVSEDDIRKIYWPYWYQRMCKRFGSEHVDRFHSFESCLRDWIVTNWAWEVKE